MLLLIKGFPRKNYRILVVLKNDRVFFLDIHMSFLRRQDLSVFLTKKKIIKLTMPVYDLITVCRVTFLI